MKRFAGATLQVIGGGLSAVSLAVPMSVLAFCVAQKYGETNPNAFILIACTLMCAILVYVGSRIPIRKNRAAWAVVFGCGAYAGMGYFAAFDIGKNALSILTPLGATLPNDILVYIGAGVLILGIALSAQGRYFLREVPKVPRTAAVAPKINASVIALLPSKTNPLLTPPTKEPESVEETLSPVVSLSSLQGATVPHSDMFAEQIEKKNDGYKEYRSTDNDVIRVKDLN